MNNSCVLDNKDKLQNVKILVEDTVRNCKFNNLDLTTDDVEKLASEIATLNNFDITERVISLYDYMANSYRTIIKDIDNHFGNFKGLIDSTQFEDFAKDKEYTDSELSLCKEILSCRNSKVLILSDECAGDTYDLYYGGYNQANNFFDAVKVSIHEFNKKLYYYNNHGYNHSCIHCSCCSV